MNNNFQKFVEALIAYNPKRLGISRVNRKVLIDKDGDIWKFTAYYNNWKGHNACHYQISNLEIESSLVPMNKMVEIIFEGLMI